MKTKTIAALAGMIAAAGLALAVPAAATGGNGYEPKPRPVCADWQMRGATGEYPNVTFGGAPAGSSVSKDSATLVKPASGVMPGVEFAAKDVGIDGPAAVISVDYQLSDGAVPDAGAIRLFYYAAEGADTLTTAPDGMAAADASSGSLVIAGVSKVGTLGLVYDASNASAGKVTFSNLKVGFRKVDFTGCPKPEPKVEVWVTQPTCESNVGTVKVSNGGRYPIWVRFNDGRPVKVWAGKSAVHEFTSGSVSVFVNGKQVGEPVAYTPPVDCPSGSPSPSPSASPSSPTPSMSTTTPPPASGGDGGGALPVTGAGVAGLATVGGLLLAAGVVFMVFTRRRRFEA